MQRISSVSSEKSSPFSPFQPVFDAQIQKNSKIFRFFSKKSLHLGKNGLK